MPGKRARRHFSQLSEFERGLIIGMKTAGWSTGRVSGQVDRSETLRQSPCGRGSRGVKVSDRGWLVTSSSPVSHKTRRVGERCTLNLSRAQTTSRWCGVVVRRGGVSSGVFLITSPWFKITRSIAKSPRVAEQCDVNIQSINLLLQIVDDK
ncbi:uncharacterized protein TNCV_3420171 [Trichonephila clavipes]|nr:uncharacterized protein TNCV_3420171 [Trichonephila clavipes]